MFKTSSKQSTTASEAERHGLFVLYPTNEDASWDVEYASFLLIGYTSVPVDMSLASWLSTDWGEMPIAHGPQTTSRCGPATLFHISFQPPGS